jgi:hypothetical protein
MQSTQERLAVVNAWEQSQYFPPTLLQTEHNFSVLGDALRGVPTLTISDVVEIVQRLGDIANGGKLLYAPKAPERIVVEVERKKTAKELSKEQFEKDTLMGFRQREIKTEFDRPELNVRQKTPQEIERQEAENLRRNTAFAEIEGVISIHCGRSHYKTSVQRDELRAERDKLVASGTDPEVVLAVVLAKRNSFKW